MQPERAPVGQVQPPGKEAVAETHYGVKEMIRRHPGSDSGSGGRRRWRFGPAALRKGGGVEAHGKKIGDGRGAALTREAEVAAVFSYKNAEEAVL
jgi:hypothetical protein